MNNEILNKIKILPEKPGVYIHKDITGDIIYIGKARVLKNRVRSYFLKSNIFDAKTDALVSNISSFEFIVTKTESEALLLENELIKKYMPRYNILLKDDKTYPYIKITVNEDFPCILKTREIKKDGSKYFGPFANVKAVNETVELINNIYSLKRCSKLIFKADYKGCLNMHINACKGYCILDKSEYKKTKNEYQKNIKEIIEFLKGKNKELITKISEEIKIASDNLNFERALKLRNYIYSLKEINERQRKLKYFLQKELFALQEKELLEKIITKELNKILKLKRKKYRIESYDISNFAGSFPVASLVVYFGLDKIKNDYRKFQIKSENGNDDYGHLKEVLQRRFENYKSGNKAFNILPDLLFIDGGKGQVNIALEVLEEFNLKLPVFGMVKDNKHRTRGLVKGSDLSEIDLKAHPNLYHYVANIQEETHRFAISFNIKKRSSSIKSKLDDIKGIGEKRRNILLRKFKNLENIKNAKIEEIRTLPTFNEELAKNVKKGL